MEASDKWIALFQWFHRHPELGYEEFGTTAKIKEVLAQHHIETVPSDLRTGVIAVVRGQQAGKVICLRADIDALPVEEQTDLAYASEKKGKMHACGHDFHITTALCTAALLQEKRSSVHGTVYFVFQPAEEVIGGAKEILRTGILDDVEEFYGFHAEPSLNAGEISCTPGSVMAAVDQFSVRITGRGCHGGAPWMGSNPIPALAAVINDIYGICGGGTDAAHTKVVSVTHVEAGNTWNVIPQEAYLEGTVRTLEPDDRKKIKKSIHNITDKWNGRDGVRVAVKWHDGPEAVVNNKELCEAAKKAIQSKALDDIALPPAMVGDDFSEYAGKVKGAKSLYLKTGTGRGPSLHNPGFCVNPGAIKITAELFAEILAERV